MEKETKGVWKGKEMRKKGKKKLKEEGGRMDGYNTIMWDEK